MLSEKEQLKDELNARFHQFIYSDEKTYTAPHVSALPNRLFSHKRTHFSKHNQPLGQGMIDVIMKNNRAQFFVWRSTPSNIKKAVYAGVLAFDALTNKCLSALGRYRRHVNNRLYLRGIISDKHELKMALLEHVQANISALEPLERLINQYHAHQAPAEHKAQLNQHLENYKNQVSKHYKTLLSFHDAFYAFDVDILIKWQQQRSDIHQQCDAFKAQVAQVKTAQACKELFMPHTPAGLLTFIKQQIDWHVRNVQEINQNLAFSQHALSLRRGDFHGVCEDALNAISHHPTDFHNPTLTSHQGNFNDAFACVNFQWHCHSQQDINEALMAVCQIEGVDALSRNKKNHYYLEKEHEKKSLIHTTHHTQWADPDAKHFFLIYPLVILWNIVAGIILGLTIDIISGLLYGLAGKNISTLASKVSINLNNAHQCNTVYAKLNGLFETKKQNITNKIFLNLHNWVKTLYLDYKKTKYFKSKQSGSFFWENNNLFADYAQGHWKNDISPLRTAFKHIETLRKTTQKEKNNIIRYAPSDYKAAHSPSSQYAIAKPPYSLTNGEWLDISNAFISVMVMGTNAFSHEIYTKNPFLGLVFLSSYGLAALAIFHPSYVAFLPKQYIQFCNTLSHALAKHKAAGAFSSASMQAQSVMAIFESVINGNVSWLANAGRYLEADPGNLALSACLATALGSLIAYRLNIPVLSASLRNELGTLPYPSLAVTGGKTVFLITSLLESKTLSTTGLQKKQLEMT